MCGVTSREIRPENKPETVFGYGVVSVLVLPKMWALGTLLEVSTVRAVATDCIVFVGVFFSVSTTTHEPLHSA